MKKLIFGLLLALLVISCHEEDEQSNDDFNGDSGTFIDERDKTEYKWVRIGDQIWMADNFSLDAGKGCWIYNNDDKYLEKNGRLYNWETAVSAHPKGWHLPSDAEYEELSKYISEQNGGYISHGEEYITGGQEWEEIGKHLKSTLDWFEKGSGIDDYGFSAYPSGYRSSTGFYSGIGLLCMFWTSSEHINGTNITGIGRGLGDINNKFGWGYEQKTVGSSVRYIKNKQ